MVWIVRKQNISKTEEPNLESFNKSQGTNQKRLSLTIKK